MNTQYYYRPEWTCGRYNEEKRAAIYYNLIEGMAYFFEDYAAMVIGEILSHPRSEQIDFGALSDTTNISIESLMPFADNLCNMGLLSTTATTDDVIEKYRGSVSKHNTEENIPQYADKRSDDYSVEMNDAELAYKNKVGGVVSVMFELTYQCSEKCIHCYNIGAARNDEEKSNRSDIKSLSIDEYKRIIDEFYDEGVIKVCLSGGDPFSNPNVWQIIEYLREKEIAVDVYTNGLNVVGKEQKLAALFPRLIGVSLYSGVASEHDAITRVKGSWEKTVSVINRLSALSVPMVIKCCIMKTNVKSYHLLSEIGDRFAIPIQYELNVTDSIEGDKCVSHYLRLTPDLLEIVLRDKKTVMYVGKESPNYGGVPINSNDNTCKAGYNTFCVTPNGELIPCCAFHLSFGSLRENSVNSILHKSERLQWWRSLKVSDYEECGKHPYCDYCNMCAGVNYSEHGTPLKAAENNCYMAKARYELATKMQKSDYDPLRGQSLTDCLNGLPDISMGNIQRVYEDREI